MAVQLESDDVAGIYADGLAYEKFPEDEWKHTVGDIHYFTVDELSRKEDLVEEARLPAVPDCWGPCPGNRRR